MENEVNIVKHFKEHNKSLCILGVLLSEEGVKIKDEMLGWLSSDYDVISVEQTLPGDLYEFPAIKYAIDYCKNNDEYCLYLHTKGAANQGPIQEKIRNMWKNEFINNKKKYIEMMDKYKNDSVILCPFTGDDKNTWFNGFYITPNAAKNTQELSSDVRRHYWESMYKENDKVKIVGRIFNNISNIKDDDNIHFLLQYIKDNF